jgi:hypothetical protein
MNVVWQFIEAEYINEALQSPDWPGKNLFSPLTSIEELLFQDTKKSSRQFFKK